MAITKTQTLTGFHLRNRIRAIFSSTTPVEQLDELKDEAKQSLLELEYLYLKTPPLQLVSFYAAVSPWCDRKDELRQLERALARIDYGQFSSVRKALGDIAAQDERCLDGVNRTSKGQRPVAETTFLGNRLGIWTQSVSHWEEHRATLASEPTIIGQSHPTVMEVIDAQASTFLSQGEKSREKSTS